MQSLSAILLAIVGVTVLVIIHETGHYLAARAFGMRVTRFAIGIGPTIFKYQPKGSPTTFELGAVPFLALVQVAGLNPFEENDAKDPALYNNQGLWARFVFAAAGPFANYLAACVIVLLVGLSGWPPEWLQEVSPDDPRAVAPPAVAFIAEGTPAAEAHLLADDIILKVEDRTVRHAGDLIAFTSPRGGQATRYTVRRGSQTLEVSMTPTNEGGVGRIGIGLKQGTHPRVKIGVSEALRLSVLYPWLATKASLSEMGRMVRERDTSGLQGPVGMGTVLQRTAERSMADFFMMLMIISTGLGLFNLLPFPPLDGARIAFVIVEFVTRRKVNEKVEAMIHGAGMIVLLSVLVLVTFREVWGKFKPAEEASPQRTSAPDAGR